MSIFDIFERLNKEKEQSRGSFEFIIAGLGNPGAKYENTRHNAGFAVLDAIAQKYNADMKKLKFKAQMGDAVIFGKRCILLKPVTYMNNSGESIEAAMSYYKIPVEKVIVCYDDITLEPPDIRIRRKGSDGGHNGIKSILTHTDEGEFPRIKIGIGKKPHKDYLLSDWVLSKFSEKEKPLIKEAAVKAVEAAELIVQGKIEEAMGRFNNN
ncbi:MAG: aminoacyl-tRNA hydrolase [Oscillospiraceae bacterium]|nr:aminoacyl-tRNA hydrolase [Oscillospiraceae bacterium]